MAKINQYPAKTVPSNNDLFVLHDPSSGSTKSMTRGDLIGGAPLPANSVDTQAIAADSVTPDKRSGGFKVGLIPASTFTSTGTKNITGVGFQPKLIRFFLRPATAFGLTALYGQGVATELDQRSTASYVDSAARRSESSNAAIFYLLGTGSYNFRAFLVTMNSDGFTLNVDIAAGGNNAEVVYEAYA